MACSLFIGLGVRLSRYGETREVKTDISDFVAIVITATLYYYAGIFNF